MGWARACYAAGALTVAGVLLLPPIAAASRLATEDTVGIAGADDEISAGQTITVNVDCDNGGVKAALWYSLKGSTGKRGKTSVKTDADGKGNGDIKLPGDLKTGTYAVSMRCGDTNIVKSEFTVVEASKSPSASPSQDKTMSVSPNTVAPGGTITIAGHCDKGTKDAKVWYGDADGSGQPYAAKSGVDAESDGKVSQALVVTDDTEPGSYDAALLCQQDGKAQTAGFTVSTGGSAAGGGSTAAGDGITLALIGGGMLAAAALGGAIYMQRRGLGVSV